MPHLSVLDLKVLSPRRSGKVPSTLSSYDKSFRMNCVDGLEWISSHPLRARAQPLPKQFWVAVTHACCSQVCRQCGFVLSHQHFHVGKKASRPNKVNVNWTTLYLATAPFFPRPPGTSRRQLRKKVPNSWAPSWARFSTRQEQTAQKHTETQVRDPLRALTVHNWVLQSIERKYGHARTNTTLLSATL